MSAAEMTTKPRRAKRRPSVIAEAARLAAIVDPAERERAIIETTAKIVGCDADKLRAAVDKVIATDEKPVDSAGAFVTIDGYVSYEPFIMDAGGLSVRRFDKKSKTPKLAALAPPFRIRGESRDGGGANWAVVITFEDGDRIERTITVKRAEAHTDARRLAARLNAAGLNFGLDAALDVVKYIAGVKVAARIRSVDHTGWQTIGEGANRRAVFVLPTETIGDLGKESVQFDADSHGAYAAHGTLAEWRREVAEPAGKHRLLTLGVSTALSGVLLDLVDGESGGLHLAGPSSTGKTTGLKVAASVWGKGDAKNGFVQSWRATANGLEAVAALSTDTALVLDELKQSEARDVAAAVYMLANEKGKARMSRSIEARKPKEWRVAVLSSGEMTVEAKMLEARQKPPAGLGVRLVEIDADAGDGCGVFDGGKERDCRIEADRLGAAAGRYYGTAGPAFVRAIMDKGTDAIAKRVRAGVEKFVDKHARGLVGQVARVAQRFGVIAAAGELAAEFGVLPWAAGTATDAAVWALRRWIEARGGGTHAAEENAALERVRELIERYGEARFDHVREGVVDSEDLNRWDGERSVSDRYGFRRGKGDEQQWLILPEVWRGVFCAGHNPKEVIKALRNAKALSQGGGVKNMTRNWKIGGKSFRGYELNAKILS